MQKRWECIQNQIWDIIDPINGECYKNPKNCIKKILIDEYDTIKNDFKKLNVYHQYFKNNKIISRANNLFCSITSSPECFKRIINKEKFNIQDNPNCDYNKTSGRITHKRKIRKYKKKSKRKLKKSRRI